MKKISGNKLLVKALVDGTDLGILHNGLDGEDGALCVLQIGRAHV